MIRVRTEPRAQRARACDGAVGRLLGEGTVRPAVRRRVRALEMAQKLAAARELVSRWHRGARLHPLQPMVR